MYNSFWGLRGGAALTVATLVGGGAVQWRCWGSCAGDGDTGAATFRWLMVLQ